MELIFTVLLTSLVLGLLLWVLNRSQVPNYRPSRAKVAELLKQVLAGTAPQQAWDLFIGYPILHDPDLELIRRQCIVLTEGDAENEPYPSGLGAYLFNKAGRARVAEILEELQELIDDEPFQQDF